MLFMSLTEILAVMQLPVVVSLNGSRPLITDNIKTQGIEAMLDQSFSCSNLLRGQSQSVSFDCCCLS